MRSLADKVIDDIFNGLMVDIRQEEFPDIIDWAERSFVDPVTKRILRFEEHQARLLRKIVMEYILRDHLVDTVCWSEIKKSGKTTVAGVVGAYWANHLESPNEVVTIANDQEQAEGRIFASMADTLVHLGGDQTRYLINMPNGSRVKAIGTNYAGEAGGNYGLTLWSELWAYSSENRRRLWDEMTQVPTRRWSVRWVETYAGFLNESDLLWELYSQLYPFGDESRVSPEAVQLFPDLEAYYIPSTRTIVYWSHTPRMPWQTNEFLESQRRSPGMRPETFVRLWENRWTTSVSKFIDMDLWDAGFDGALPALCPEDDRLVVLGCDASIHRDSTSLVAATYDPFPELKPGVANPLYTHASILHSRIWNPVFSSAAGKMAVDLDETIKAEIVRLLDGWKIKVAAIVYDPYQLHSIMTDLQKKYDRSGTKKLFWEFPQTTGRIESDMFFFDVINSRRLHHKGDRDLRIHVNNAVAKETERGFRLDKDAGQKIDGAVAAAQAVYGASERIRKERKFVKV